MSSTSNKREEMLRRKAEDEARKAGTLPPEKDRHGQVINPHIPEFMSKVPWYAQNEGEEAHIGLDHQRLSENRKDHSDIGVGWYERGGATASAAATTTTSTRFVKGACENCGATTHQAKYCLEKPRKVGAMALGRRLARDDVALPDLNLSYDGKRDKYNGFSAESHLDHVRQRRQLAELQQQQQQSASAAASTSSSSAKPQSNSLRVRTDTAKYLRNLDPESAFYDPKTRSMRANPTPHLSLEQTSFVGDNFVKTSGEVREFDEMAEFAQGNLMSNPTAMAMQRRQFVDMVKTGEQEAQAKRRATALEYTQGSSSSSSSSSAAALPSSSTTYVEYTPDGRRVEDKDSMVAPSSKYEEDVLEGNHTEIWGSYFDREAMAWGYGCCCQTVRNSYCIGERGKEAAREAKRKLELMRSGQLTVVATAAEGEEVKKPEEKKDKKRPSAAAAVQDDDDDASSTTSSSSSDWNSSSDDEDGGGKAKSSSSSRSKKHNSSSSSSKEKKRKKHKKDRKEKKSKKSKKSSSSKDERRERRRSRGKDAAAASSSSVPQPPTAEELARMARIRVGDPMFPAAQ